MRAYFLLLAALGAAPAARATPRTLAVMPARSVGLEQRDLEAIHQDLRAAFSAALKGSDWGLASDGELARAQAEIPGCKVGTCDMQAAKRAEAHAVVSVEAVLIRGEFSLSLRLFETREGALLAKAGADVPSLAELRKQVGPASSSVAGTLLKAHAAALAQMTAPGAKYLLVPPEGTPSAWTSGKAPAAPVKNAAAGGVKRLVLDGEQANLAQLLREVNPALNACFDTLLQKNKKARGRMLVELDVEPDGAVSDVRMIENGLRSEQMAGCVAGRLRKLRFAAAEKPWQVRFPLVFVPARK